MSVIMLTEAVARIREIISGPGRTKGSRGSAAFAARATKASPQPLMSLNPNPTGVRITGSFVFLYFIYSCLFIVIY